MASAFILDRGTNISHWLSQGKARGEERKNWFTKTDVDAIAKMGFDHIRLPVDEEQMWDESGKPEPEAFGLLDDCLDWCAKAGLNAVVDLHILRSHYFNDSRTPRLFSDPGEQEKFLGFWEQLSSHLRKRPVSSVCYELLNEPIASDDGDWNRVSAPVFRALRAAEPGRTIILGSNRFNSVLAFDTLEVPEDKNCILTFHFYYPMFLTHYKASWWKGGKYGGPVAYPGAPIPAAEWMKLDPGFRKEMEGNNTVFGRSEMVKLLEQPLRARDRTGLKLYCGEFGCYKAAPLDLRLAWYRDIISVFKEYSIAWANWDYKGGFGLVDAKGVSTGINGALLG